MKYFSISLIILLFSNICDVCKAQSQTIQQIQIDKLTSEYLSVEKQLWVKIGTQQILVDRGNLLNEVYREHKRILNNDFGGSKTIWSLGIQKNQQLINTMLSIDTNQRNIQDYLTNGEHTKMEDLAKSTAVSMEKSMDDLFQSITDQTFWTNILANVR